MSALDTVASDFDFQTGSWQVTHRRLKERLCGCDDWQVFNGTSEMRPVLGGRGNIEDNFLDMPGGPMRAIAIRSYDEALGTWAIWWLSTAAPHVLDVPVIGRFENGSGRFLAEDSLDGRPILVRFLWLRTDSPTPRWEQAFSDDAGKTWETNWTMDFARAA
jgi:hypothetical protein